MKQLMIIATFLFTCWHLVSCVDDEKRILSAIVSAFEDRSPTILNKKEGELDDSYIPQVEITAGLLSGVSFPEAHGFYNVPYAEPPVGKMRFKKTQIMSKFPDGKFEANNVSNQVTCYQRSQEGCSNGLCLDNLSENCLVLNIHIPKAINLSLFSTPRGDRLPVLVWIHGGGLQTGSGTAPLYDGRFLSNATNTVVVSINYRLGIFGFMPVPDDSGTIRNQGFHDQQLALEWIHENIEKFGGDASKVTIFGQSAGAQAVMFHLMSQKSSTYFQHAILEGHPAIFQYFNLNEALETTQQVLNLSKCRAPEGEGIECLREKPPGDLLNIAGRIQLQNILNGNLFGAISPFSLVLDGDEFTQNPLEFVQKGNWFETKVALMGTNTQEMNNIEVFIPDFINIRKETFERLLKFVLGEEVGTLVAAKYSETVEEFDNDYIALLGEVATDGFFVCPTRALARLASKLTNVYLYSFAHALDDPSCESSWSPSGSCGYVYHSTENSLVFRSDSLIPYNFSSNDTIAANQFSYYWGNLAYAGDPSSGNVTGDFPEWPAYLSGNTSTKNQVSSYKINRKTPKFGPHTNYVIDAPEGRYDQLYKEEICDFWDSTKFYVDLENDETTTTKTSTSTSGSTPSTTKGLLEETTSGTKGLLEETTSGSSEQVMSSALFLVTCLSIFGRFFNSF